MRIRAKNQNSNTKNSLRGPHRSLLLSYPGMWVWEKPNSGAGAHKPLTRKIHRETQGKEPQGPRDKLWF